VARCSASSDGAAIKLFVFEALLVGS